MERGAWSVRYSLIYPSGDERHPALIVATADVGLNEQIKKLWQIALF
jgi:hypothetical protein